MAGEFLVAGELQRRHVMASVTFGASKRADIFALSPNSLQVARIEVKTTSKEKWPVGARCLAQANWGKSVFWVLVYLPSDNDAPPEYYVLSARAIGSIALKAHREFAVQYEKKHGKAPGTLGVPFVTREQVREFKSRWEEIVSFLRVSDSPDNGSLRTITERFHDMIRQIGLKHIGQPLVESAEFKFPQISQIEDSSEEAVWLPVPGMYGGFNYRLEHRMAGPCLVVENWSRVIEGSGQRHEITADSTELIEEGFV